ncbi:MAG: hypothetical protein FJ100_15345 [Deltaproteobacteria bacterium]|nr:hypothetical protein [Deltaproteobacteria bacterium]
MDDFALCGTDPARLEAARDRIIGWLADRRHLTCHADAQLTVASRGVDFVGHIVRPACALPRRRVTIAAHERMHRVQARLRPVRVELGRPLRLCGGLGVPGPAAVYPLAGEHLAALRDAWAAFAAVCRQADAQQLRQRMTASHPLLQFHVGNRRQPYTVRYWPGLGRPAGQPDLSLLTQLRRLVGHRRDVAVLMQVGGYCEGLRREDWRALRLRPHRLGRQRFGCGVPMRLAADWIRSLLAKGVSVPWIAETGLRADRVAERCPSALIVPQNRTIRAWAARVGSPWLPHRVPAWQLRRCIALRRGKGRPFRRPPRRRTLASSAAPPLLMPSGQNLWPFASLWGTIGTAPEATP